MQLTQAKIYTACLVRIGGATKERGENSRDRVSFFAKLWNRGIENFGVLSATDFPEGSVRLFLYRPYACVWVVWLILYM